MSNHIDHIEITNFKSIRHMKIEGCKRINVLIGYPNVGKSAILEAISALSYLQKDFYEPYNKLCRLKYPNELFYNGNIHDDATISYAENIKVTFRYYDESSLSFAAEFQGDADDTWHYFKHLRFRNNDVDRVTVNGTKDLIKVKKYQFQNEFNDFKTNGLVLDFPFGKNLVDIVHLNKEVRTEVASLFKQSGLKLNIDLSNNTIKGFKQLDEELVFTVPFYQMADTLQRLIFHKAAIRSNSDSVLLFEEPEAHMFPPYIRTFTGDVIFDKSNNQFFIATHSPVVIEDFLEDARDDLSVYLVGLKDGESILKRLSEEELKEVYEYGVDLFFNLESYLS